MADPSHSWPARFRQRETRKALWEFTIQSAVVSESAVSLTVYIEPSGGAAVNGLNLSLSYEEGVRVESLLEGEAFGGALLADAGAPGGVWMIWDSADPYTGGKTVLFTVVFSLVPQAPEGLYAYGLSCRELYASQGPRMAGLSPRISRITPPRLRSWRQSGWGNGWPLPRRKPP